MTITAGSITKDLERFEAAATLYDLYQHKETRHWMEEIGRYVKKRANDGISGGDSKGGRALKRLREAASLAVPPGLWIDAPDTLYLLKPAAELPQSRGLSLQQAFLHLLFFDVSNALSPNYKRISQSLVDLVMREFDPAEQVEVDQKLLRHCIRMGSFYNSLIQHLGEGCVFFLPNDIPLDVWEYLSVSVVQAVSFLEGLGIQEQIKRYNATEKGRRVRRELSRDILEKLCGRVSTHCLQASSSAQRLIGPVKWHFLEPRTRSNHSQHTNESSSRLCGLLYSMGPSAIPERLLLHGTSPQQRWNSEGEICTISLTDAGLDDSFVRLFSTEHDLKQALESCIRKGVIFRTQLDDGSVAYSLCNEAWTPNTSEDVLMLQGLIFLAYIFPREEALHTSYHKDGKFLLPYVQRLWRYVLSEKCPRIPGLVRESLTEASLAASRLSRSKDAIAVAEKMQDLGLPAYLQLSIVYRKSVALRMKGAPYQSEAMILETLEAEITTDIRTRCCYGRLLLSNTENAIQQEQFKEAVFYLDKVPTSEASPSAFEVQILRLKSTVHGRLSRYKGDFSHAVECLTLCLQTVKNSSARYHHKHHLADVYCELGHPDKAQALLVDDIQSLATTKRQHSKAVRRLQLPWAEACILQRDFEKAESILEQLEETFGILSDKDVTDHLGHVRSTFGLLRIHYLCCRWNKALEWTDKAFELMQTYKSFSAKSFYKGVSFLFRAIILFELGRRLESMAAYMRVKEYEEAPRHFIPGMGTYVFRELCSKANKSQLAMHNMSYP